MIDLFIAWLFPRFKRRIFAEVIATCESLVDRGLMVRSGREADGSPHYELTELGRRALVDTEAV